MPRDNPPPSDPNRGDERGLVPGTLEGDLTNPADRGQSRAAGRDEDRDSPPTDDDGNPLPKTTSLGIQPGDMQDFAQVRPGDTDGEDGTPDLTDATPAELAAVEGVEPDLITPPGDHLGPADRNADGPESTQGTELDDDPTRGEGSGETHQPDTSPEDPERFGEQDNLDGDDSNSAEAVHDDKQGFGEG